MEATPNRWKLPYLLDAAGFARSLGHTENAPGHEITQKRLRCLRMFVIPPLADLPSLSTSREQRCHVSAAHDQIFNNGDDSRVNRWKENKREAEKENILRRMGKRQHLREEGGGGLKLEK